MSGKPIGKLSELLALEATQLSTFFERASLEGRGTPQEISDRREDALTNFLSRYFPRPNSIVKGNIVDIRGKESASIDCVGLSPSHPKTLDSNKRASIILAEGVDFAIELKPDLNSKKELARAFKQVASVKRLYRERLGVVEVRYSEEALRVLHQIPCIIFAEKIFKSVEKTIETIVDLIEENEIKRSEQFDYIVVNNWGVIFNVAKYSYCDFALPRGLYWVEIGSSTLGYLLYVLDRLPKSEMSVGDGILSAYLDLDPTRFWQETELNERIRNYEEIP